ncbi:hypothetical protein OAO01_00010 [Oligoflexia bacterium]|nr:hypothetical protein [Oligoflexia bacterium]
MSNKYIIILVALVALFYLTRSPQQAPEVALRSLNGTSATSTDPCANKERCIAVFLSPWCPACKRAVTTIPALREYCMRSDKVGFKVIVGRDSVEALESFALSIGGQVFIDAESEFYTGIKGSSIPGWWVWDENRNILAKFSGTFVGPKEVVIKRIIDDKLKLSEYF